MSGIQTGPVLSLQFFRSVQSTCTELLKVIEKYQHRITRESPSKPDPYLYLAFGRHGIFTAAVIV